MKHDPKTMLLMVMASGLAFASSAALTSSDPIEEIYSARRSLLYDLEKQAIEEERERRRREEEEELRLDFMIHRFQVKCETLPKEYYSRSSTSLKSTSTFGRRNQRQKRRDARRSR